MIKCLCNKYYLDKKEMACVPRPVPEENAGFIAYYRSHCACCDAQGPRFACSRCKAAHYCNAEHQTVDWSRHKGECQRWAQIPRPEVLPPPGLPDNIMAQHRAVRKWREGPLDETEAAAEGGNADAQFALSQRLLFGIGVPKDLKKGIVYLRKASDKGHASAQTNWAAYLIDGQIVKKNLEEALKLFMLAAKQGLPDAQYELARIYENGEGVGKNIEEAIRYYRLAANAGDDDAKAALVRLGRPFVNTRDRSRTRKRKQRKTRKN